MRLANNARHPVRLPTEKRPSDIAEEYEKAYRTALTEAQARKTLSRIYEEVTETKLKSTTINDYFNSWLKRRKGEVSPASYSAYKKPIETFLEHIGDLKNKEMAFLTQETIIKWRDSLLDSLSPRTINHRIKCIRLVLNDALRGELLLRNPAQSIRLLKTESAENNQCLDPTS